MTGIYNTSGQVLTTVVDGSTRTGLYAADGSWNIVINDGSAIKGKYHPCGAFNAVVSGSASSSATAANGSLNVYTNSTGGYSPTPFYIAASAFVPLAGSLIDLDLQNGNYFGGTPSNCFNAGKTQAAGLLQSTLLSGTASMVLSLKTMPAPSGQNWFTEDTEFIIFRGLSDTVVRTDNGSTLANATLGSGSFSGTPSKVGMAWDITNATIVGNNGTVATTGDGPLSGYINVNIGLNVDSFINRLTVWNTKLPSATLKGFTV